MNRSPWTYLQVDDFLSRDILARAQVELAGTDYKFDIESRGTGRIEYSLLESEALWRAVYSRETIALLHEAFGVRLRLNKGNMLQLRRMNEATPEFPRHEDHVAGASTIAAFLYLSDGWTPARGGRLCLYSSEDDQGEPTYVEPWQNRFVAFETKPDHWHSVERVHGWERLSVLSMWDIDEPVA